MKLNLRDVRPHFTINYERGFDDFYAAEMDLAIDSLALQASEVAEARWASLDEIRKMEGEHSFTPYFPGVIELLFQVLPLHLIEQFRQQLMKLLIEKHQHLQFSDNQS